jgi:hypothetical protein
LLSFTSRAPGVRHAFVQLCLALVLVGSASAQFKPRKLGELELVLSGISATVDPIKVTVPKNTASGVRISIRGGAGDVTIAEAERFLGGPFAIEGDLAGPGLLAPVRLPQADAPNNGDPLLLHIPPLPQSGNYTLSNLRITRNGSTALDITPSRVDVEVIEQVLITSVTTRPLTLEEIKAKGIILDDDSYLGFEFTLGIALDSKAVQFTFPVVFDHRGVAVPQPLLPGAEPERATMPPLTTIIPMLLKPSDGDAPTVRLPNGTTEEVRIPSVLVIPGNVGYLKQFFSAKLFVANGAPGSSNLTVHNVTGTIKLPPGADRVLNTADDPLMLPNTTRGPQPKVMPVVGAGADGQLGTGDDVVSFSPGQQGEAEFLLRGEKEGFHQIDFDISASLQGLVTGPVTVTGSGSGGVLVRNPYFDMTFTAPAIVRQGEPFKMYVTVNNISQALANDVQVTLDGARMSGARLVGDTTKSIDTLQPRDSRMLEFDFIAERTGQVVATYLNLETQDGSTGRLKFTLAVGERGIPLSPDTLVLPVAVDYLPQSVVAAAMRVLGQGWSIANAPSGTLPKEVIRTSRGIVTQKALALAEAGLRVSLGQSDADAVRDLLFDFYGANENTAVDAGFDQLLRTTNAGTDLARAIGNALKNTADIAGGAAAYERTVSSVAASGPNFVAFAFGNASGAPVTATLTDNSGHESIAGSTSNTFVNGSVASAVAVPFGTSATASRLVLVPAPADGPYTLVLTGTGSGTIDLSVTLPNGSSFRRATTQVNVTNHGRYRIVADSTLTLDIDSDGDGVFESQQPLTTETLIANGPRLISANAIGPETVSGAPPFGFQTVLLFDRIVDTTTSSAVANYSIPNNRVVSAKKQLSGRLVFASLEQPEGPYVSTQLSVNGITDLRGKTGPGATVPLGSRLEDIGAVVSGRILGADGTPMPNALVTYAQNPEILCAPPLGDYKGLTNVRTNNDGRYELRYVRQDQCGMAFQIATKDPSTNALRSVSSSVRAAGEQIVLDIAMLGRGSVAGTVRSLNGAPVSGATVVALSQTDTQSQGSALSDSQGHYQIDNVVVGPVTVRAVKDAALGKSFGRIDRAGTAATVDLTLDGGTVSANGTVRTVHGSDVQAVPGLQVVYRVKALNGFDFIPIELATTDSNGKYFMTGLPIGEYRIEALLNSRDRGFVTGIAAVGDVVHQDIPIVLGNEGYGTVRGTVRFPDGAPASDIVVSIDGSGVLTSANGTFELVGLAIKPTTEQTIRAESRDGLRAGSTRVLLSQPNQVITNVAITLSGVGTAEFTLLDANRNPVANQEVDLLGTCWNPCGCAAKTTNSQGKVSFTNIRLGTVQARALRTMGETWDQADASVSLMSDGATAFGVLIFPGTGTVTGTVLNPDGTPSMGADIRLRSKIFDEDSCSLISGQSQRMRTDANGKFRFNSVNVGQISVTATHPFFTTSVGGNGSLTANGSTVDFQLKLVNTISGVLSGVVYLPDGVTPAGAGVEVTAVGPLPEVTVTTGADGYYEFAKIFPEGSYSVTARDAVTGGLRRDTVYLKAAQDVEHDIRLKGKGTVRVRVVDGAGQPVSNAFIRLEETQFPNRLYEAAIGASNGGVATFENVFEGPVTAQASDVFARGGRASSTLAGPGATLELTVALTTTGTVQGYFLRADGNTPIPFGSVKLVVGGRTVGQATTDGVDDIGFFAFDYVPSGAFRLEAQDPQTARSGIAVGTISTEGEVVDVDIVAQGVGRVSGLVTSNGAPQPGAHVRINSGNNFDTLTYTDSTGRYSIDGVPVGHINATATLSGNFLTGTNSGNLDGEGGALTLDVALRDSGRLTGHVLNAVGATPAPLSLITVQVGGVGGAKLETTTDPAGAFALDRVPAGFATVSAEVLGSIDKANGVADVIGSQTTDVTLTLNGVGAITGLALDSAGTPIRGDVTITGTGYSFTVQAQADGTFALPQVLAGPFSVALKAKSGEFTLYGTANGSVPASGTANVTVQVQPSGTVTGLVLRADNTTPAVGANVVLQLDGGGSVTVQAGNDGRFTARGVPFSTFTVRINDTISTGLALSSGSITTNGQTLDLGTLVLDDQPLGVVSVTPAAGTIGVSLTQPLTVTFSNQLASAFGITVRKGTTTIGSSPALSTDKKTVTLTGTWPDSSELNVNVSTSVTDVFGRHPLQVVTSTFHTIDTSGPKVASVVPASGTIQVPANATITMTFDESLHATNDPNAIVTLQKGAVVVAGTAAMTSPTTIVFTPSSPLLDNSIYTVKAVDARDVSGNVQTQDFTSTFATTDTVAPVLTVSSPSNDSWGRNLRPQIQVNAVDPTSGVNGASAALSLDGTAVTPQVSGATFYYTPAADLAEGLHTVNASVQDRAANLGTVSSTFKLDATAPTVPALTGISQGATLTGTLTIGASSSDATSGVAQIDLFVENSNFLDVLPAGFTASYNTQNLAEGWHAFSAQAVDVAGNISARSAPVNALVNNRPLTIAFSSPVANLQVRDAVSASVTVSEPVDTLQFSAGGQTVTDNTAPYEATFTLTNAPEGPLTITVSATAGSGETATATRVVIVDRTAPAKPDVTRITAEPPANGSSLIFGYPSAVEPNATVEITNTVSSALAAVKASSDGSFSMFIAGAIDDALTVVAIDAVGNRSEPATIRIRSTPSLPPSEGATTLHYDGILVDRVGPAAGATAMTPDGNLDAVFTVSLAIGDGVTRTISYIDLTGPLTRSTRASVTPLGVAQDAGSALLNNATGQINFPVTSGTTLTLFASDAGFIRDGSEYTVKAVFTDGSQFVGTYYIVPKEDRTYVAHSADVSANPPTVIAGGAALPGTTTITVSNIRDSEGTLVPDGGKIALAVADMASVNGVAAAFRSAGGEIQGGQPAANSAVFRVFTISGGSVTATYSSTSVVPAARSGALAIVQVLGADADDNVLGTEAVSSLDINLRPPADPAIVHVSPSTLYADRADRRAHIRVQVRDTAGNPVVDGTKVLLSAANSASVIGCCFVGSAGGDIIGGTNSPTSSIYKVFTVAGGIVEADYSSLNVVSNVGEVKTAVIQVLPADANGARTSQAALGTATIAMTGAATTEVAVSPQTVPYVFPNPPIVQVDVHHAHDARARLIPDGAKLLVSASNSASVSGCCFVGSAGGTIADGTVSPTSSIYKYFPLVSNFFRTTWTQQGVQQVDSGQERTSVVQVLSGDSAGARIDQRLIGSASIKVLGPMNARGSADDVSIFGDGNLQTTHVRFEHILDTHGNPLPDGSKVVVSAANSQTYVGCCYIGSIGGQIVNGDPSPTATFKVFTIQDGGIDVTYGNQGIISGPTETKTANVVLAQAGANGERLSQIALGIVPVQTVGTASAAVAAFPTAIFSDGNDHRSTITISSIKDLAGRPVPDGTLIGVTAASGVSYVGCCYIFSAGGTILDGTPAPNNGNFKVFPVTNGQVVVQYSSQGILVSEGERIANIAIVAVSAQNNVITNQAIGTAPVRLLAPASAAVAVAPGNLTAHSPSSSQLSQITITDLKSADGLTMPDGSKIGISVGNAVTFINGNYNFSAGGTILSSGTNPDDGTPAPNNGNFKVFTVSGGQVHAVYDGSTVAAGTGEVKIAIVQVVPVSSTNNVLTTHALGVAPIRVNGVASTNASGPATLKITNTATVTFSNIRDAAGNVVPDGTPVAVTAGNAITHTSGNYNFSAGGTIVNGNVSPSAAYWKWFTVQGGSISVEYSTQGVTAGLPAVTRLQIVPARNDGTVYGGATLSGGSFPITLTN